MTASAGASSGHVEPVGADAVAVDAVWMLSVELAEEPPGVTDAGEKVATAPVGRPLAVRLTGLENVPFCAVAVMVNWAAPPD